MVRGRPDMAPMIFAKAILNGKEIKVNNYRKMSQTLHTSMTL